MVEEVQNNVSSTTLSTFDNAMWQGIPSIFDLGGTRIGAIHPTRKDANTVQMVLTVLDWKNSKLETVAVIPLCSYPTLSF